MPSGIYKHKPCSEETRIKLKKNKPPFQKGKKFPNRKKPAPFSEETRKKMSLKLIGNKHTLGFKHSEKTKKLMSKILKGKKKTEEWKNKVSEIRIKKGLSRKEKNPAWKGGISFLPYSIDWTITLKRSIRERDNYICQICNQYGLDVHHIDYDKQNCNPNNLITLCHKCHMKTNHKRDYWINYFKNK